jgi:hypothetical protein
VDTPQLGEKHFRMRLVASKARERRVVLVVRLAAGARVALGVALTVGTRPLVGAMAPEVVPSGTLLLFARTVGIRDALFGLGCLLAARQERRSDLRRWVGIWAANEVADVVAALSAVRLLGPRGALLAAAPPLPFIAVDRWALRQLRQHP